MRLGKSWGNTCDDGWQPKVFRRVLAPQCQPGTDPQSRHPFVAKAPLAYDQ